MSNNDDEFKDVEMGLPPSDMAQKSSIKFTSVFLVGGVLIAMLILFVGDILGDILGIDNFIPTQMLMNGAISLIIGSLQAWIFKSKIKSRIYVFISFSLLGGLLGGLIGGILINSGTRSSVIVGAVNGILAGGISSLAQNRLMGNKKYGARWFLYNLISWAAIYSIAWTVAWKPNTLTLALASAFIMVASGISLVVFLRKTPQIEFS